MDLVIGVVILVLILVAIISYAIHLFNKMVALQQNVKKAFANIDVLLKQRFNEIPNLVKVVKAYADYEKSLFKEITEIRALNYQKLNQQKKVELSNQLESVFERASIIAEDYPDLKANKNYLDLQHRITDLENQLAHRREFYNESVRLFNVERAEFPQVLFSSLLGFRKKEMLQFTFKPKSI